jgi:aminoglycoside phosphotransferase (APT) family kinase protein
MMHPDQLTVTAGTVAALVAEQFPGWAGLPVLEVRSQGTDNALFRLGDRLAARFPIQPADPARTLRWLAGVIDVGSLGPAGPALDLVGAWHLLGAGPRQILRDDLGCDDREWERGKAWAFAQAMGLVWYYVTSNPTMAFVGRRTLDRLLEDSAAGQSGGPR